MGNTVTCPRSGTTGPEGRPPERRWARIAGWFLLPSVLFFWLVFHKLGADHTVILMGTVTDVATGEPIQGAEVYFAGPDNPAGDDGWERVQTSTRTDSEGRYSLQVGRYPKWGRVSVAAPGYATANTNFSGQTLRRGKQQMDVPLEAEPGVSLDLAGFQSSAPPRVGLGDWLQTKIHEAMGQYAISGWISDFGGQPIAGATVIAKTWDNGPRGMTQATADPDGRFCLTNIADARAYRLFVNAPGKYGVLAEVKLPPGKGMEDLRFALGPEAQLAGRIVDTTGRAVANAVIDFTWNLGDGQVGRGPAQPMPYPLFSPMKTDPEGWFHLREIAPGTWRFFVGVTRADCGYWQLALDTVTVAAGQTLSDVEIRLRAPEEFSIRGQVRDDQGNGVPGWEVSAYHRSGHCFFARTDPQGNYWLRGLDGLENGTANIHGRPDRTSPATLFLKDVSIGTTNADIVLPTSAPSTADPGVSGTHRSFP